ATGGLDDNRLLLPRCLVLGGHVQDAVGIQVECHFDLRHTTRRRWNVGQVETTQRLVLCSLLALTLYHMNGDGGLVVVGSRENLRLLGRNRGVLLDQEARHATHGFDTQGQRRHVQQQYIVYLT